MTHTVAAIGGLLGSAGMEPLPGAEKREVGILMRLTYQCPDCKRPMSRADYSYSIDLHREGRCQRCQWQRDERQYHCLYVTAA